MNKLQQLANSQNGIIYANQLDEWLLDVEKQLDAQQADVDGNMSLHHFYNEGYHNGIDYALDVIGK